MEYGVIFHSNYHYTGTQNINAHSSISLVVGKYGWIGGWMDGWMGEDREFERKDKTRKEKKRKEFFPFRVFAVS